MAKKKKKKSSPIWILVGLVIAAGSWYFQQQDDGFDSTRPNIEVGDEPARAEKLGGYDVLTGCRLIENSRNDGDSFFVQHVDGETEFRLYFVDAPESRYKEYPNGESNGDRISKQGQYFNGLNRRETTQVGGKSKTFVTRLLAERPFVVLTKWSNVYGPERKYAFVLVEVEGKQRYLHELLVEKGLARIHTSGAEIPLGVSSKEQKRKLREKEVEAKRLRFGAWAM